MKQSEVVKEQPHTSADHQERENDTVPVGAMAPVAGPAARAVPVGPRPPTDSFFERFAVVAGIALQAAFIALIVCHGLLQSSRATGVSARVPSAGSSAATRPTRPRLASGATDPTPGRSKEYRNYRVAGTRRRRPESAPVPSHPIQNSRNWNKSSSVSLQFG